MAYNTSQDYKNLIYDEDAIQTLDVIINGRAIDEDYVMGVSLDDDCFDSDFFSLGSAQPCKIELTLANEFDEPFEEITLVSKLEISDSVTEEVPIGTFFVVEVSNQSEYSTKYILYDSMTKFNIEGFDASEFVPCTRLKLVQEICKYCGVELGSTSFINSNVIVNTYDSTFKPITYLNFISERAGGFAKIGRDGKLYIKSYGEVDEHILPEELLGEFTNDEQRTISKVVYENAVQKFEAGDDTGITIFLSNDSPFTCSQDEVDNIYNSIKGLKIQSVNLRIWGDPAIDTGDIIKCGDFVSFAQKSWSNGNGWYGYYTTTLKEVTEASKVTKVSTKTKSRKFQSEIDEIDGRIKTLAQDIDGNNSKITEVEQTINGVKTTVESTKEVVQELSDIVEVYSVSLDINNIIIPVDEFAKPLNDMTYVVKASSTFKGSPVKSIISTSSSNSGISCSINDNEITFNVQKDTKITNLNNEYIIDFIYKDGDNIYSLNCKLLITLNLQAEKSIILQIESSKGTVFKNDSVSTLLSVTIYRGTDRITDMETLRSVLGNDVFIQWKWKRLNDEDYGVISNSDSRIGNDGFTFTLSPEDVDTKVTFLCELIK